MTGLTLLLYRQEGSTGVMQHMLLILLSAKTGTTLLAHIPPATRTEARLTLQPQVFGVPLDPPLLDFYIHCG